MGVELRDPEAFADVSPHVVVFEVLSIAPGTNGDPPRGQIRIDAVLRGNLECETRDAVFPPHHAAFQESGKSDHAAWRAEPRVGPAVGTRLVAAVEVTYDRIVQVNGKACWSDDDARRARIYRGPTISIISVSMDGDEAKEHGNPHDAFEAIEVAERRNRSAGWVSFPLRSGRRLCTFLMDATSTDLSVLGCDEVIDRAGWKVATALIADADIKQVLPRLEELVETNDAVTAYALVVHGGARNLDAIADALSSGTWPTNGDPAEEAAAFARHLLTLMRIAKKTLMGVCWEYRGDVTVAPKAVARMPEGGVTSEPVLPPPTQRMRELEKLLVTIRNACNNMVFNEMWEAHGREHATPEYIAEMEADVAESSRNRARATTELAALVTATRAECPHEIEAWVNAHQAYLSAFIADCVANGEGDSTGTMVANNEHVAWAEVRAGTRLFVDENAYYVTLNRERYIRLLGIDP